MDSASKRPETRSKASQTLVSAIGTPKGLKPPILKNLYGLLVRMSLNKLIPSSNDEDHLNHFDPGFDLGELVMRSVERNSVGDLLFRELDFRFETLFSALCDVSASSEKVRALLQLDMPARVEELTLLLRCCMVLLTLADQDVVLEKTRVILEILRRLIDFVMSGNRKGYVTLKKQVSSESSYRDDACAACVSEDFVALLSILEPSDICHPLLCAVLEVFADELLLHRLLREYFVRVDSASCSSRSLFGCHFLSGDIGSVLEVISVHFILSLSDEEAFENFHNRLSCRAGKDLRVSELSLTAALSLLLNPTILSAPKILQACLILLVSKAVGCSMSMENIGINLRLMGASYLTAFEMSVILYTGFMSTFLMDGHPIGMKSSFSTPGLFDGSHEPSFECYIQEITRAKIDDIVAKTDSLWKLEQRSVFNKEKPHLLFDSMVFMSESQVEESCKSDIFSILSSIIFGAFSDSFTSDIVLREKVQTSSQFVYLLSAILKLMSSSMSAVIRWLRYDSNGVCLNNTEGASPCKEYDSIVSIIGCFGHFNVSLPNQKKLFDKMETHLIRHKTTKWMLLHFSGLLSVCFASGFDFLVENCISTMVMLMNLYVLEEGTIGALRSTLVSDSKSFSPLVPSHELGETSADQKLCIKVASRIRKIQRMFMSSESCLEDSKAKTSLNACVLSFKRDSSFEIEEETEETCNGKVFLDCILEGPSKASDCDELADFIKCKPGKDYSNWLKDKKTHRKWRSEKMAVIRWKKRRKTWKLMAGVSKPKLL